MYISGNPGSGKSQLAGLVAKRFFDEARDIPSSTPCVMALNAASPDSLLESYALMARQVLSALNMPLQTQLTRRMSKQRRKSQI